MDKTTDQQVIIMEDANYCDQDAPGLAEEGALNAQAIVWTVSWYCRSPSYPRRQV